MGNVQPLRAPAAPRCPQCQGLGCGQVSCRFSGLQHEKWKSMPDCTYRPGLKCSPSCTRTGHCLDVA